MRVSDTASTWLGAQNVERIMKQTGGSVNWTSHLARSSAESVGKMGRGEWGYIAHRISPPERALPGLAGVFLLTNARSEGNERVSRSSKCAV
jgi:hypothetical protein